MNTLLQNAIQAAEHLPDTDQEELAAQIEEMVTQRKIALAEADIAAGRVRPANEVFAQLRTRYGG